MNGSRFALAVALSFASGCAALVHQMVWIRRMVDALGATSDTFAAVAGAFFLGLAVGGWIASSAEADGVRPFWRGVALAEVAVGALAVIALVSAAFSPALAASRVPDAMVRLVVPVVVIGPPAVAMGLVTPWLIRAAASGQRPVAVPIYLANTAGGISGIFAALLWLIPGLGTVAAGVVAIAANVCIAAAALAGARSWSPKSPRLLALWKLPPLPRPKTLLAVAFASGFLVLSVEVVVQMQLAQVTVSSTFSSGTVLASVLVGLTLGAALSGGWRAAFASDGSALAGALVASAAALAVQPVLFHFAFGGLRYLPYSTGALEYILQLLPRSGLAAALPFVAAGLVFPLLLRSLEAGGWHPRWIGIALAANGLGGWLGAEVAQALLLPRFGLWGAASVCAAAYSIAALGVAGKFGVWRIWAFGALAGSVVAWMFVSGQPHVLPAPGDSVRAIGVGREGVVAVVSGADDDWRIVFNNSYTLGGSRAASNQERQAHLPILLHGNAKRVATLGLATGSTASAALRHPGVERLDAVELSQLVMDYADRYFSEFNHGLFGDPRVNPIRADARWEILRNPGTYDVVIGDLFLPWRSGEGRLYSREHFEAVKRSLRPGGIFCQWLPLYQLSEEQFFAIARTFRTAFPDAFLIRGDFYHEMPIVGLVGGRDLGLIDWGDISAAAAALRADDRVRDPLVRHAEGVAMLVAGPLGPVDPGPVTTLDNAWIEWDAGRNVIAKDPRWFVGLPLAQFLRERSRAGSSAVPEPLQRAHRAGDFFLTLAVAHASRTRLDELMARIADWLPEPMQSDPDADWSRWPGRPKPLE